MPVKIWKLKYSFIVERQIYESKNIPWDSSAPFTIIIPGKIKHLLK